MKHFSEVFDIIVTDAPAKFYLFTATIKVYVLSVNDADSIKSFTRLYVRVVLGFIKCSHY